MIIFLISSIALLFILAYFVLVRWFVYHWRKTPVWQAPEGFQPSTSVTILIPARNEALNIQACLNSILHQSYPPELMEIIVIDDHSEDDTPHLVQAYQDSRVRLLQLADHLDYETSSYKKAAIQIGVAAATGHLIITTDADCLAPPKWLWHLSSLYEHQQPQCIAGPVAFYQEQNGLERFQSLDFLGMMVITGAGIGSTKMYMGNGANLAYPRAVFERVNGFEGVKDWASGDDLFLIHKIAAQYPGGVSFLKQAEATILTRAKPDLSSFIQQRIRWGTKNTSYKGWAVMLIAGTVFLACWSLLVMAFAIPWGGWPSIGFFLFLLGIKTWADYQLLREATSFFGRRDLRRYFMPAQIGHILYIALIGLASLVVKRYEWKGRKVR